MAVPDAQVTLLRDKEATAARILDEIEALQSRVADGDRVFIYYSGHGTRWFEAVSYTHLRAHETVLDLVCRLLLENNNTHLPNSHNSHDAITTRLVTI